MQEEEDMRVAGFRNRMNWQTRKQTGKGSVKLQSKEKRTKKMKRKRKRKAIHDRKMHKGFI